MKIRITDNADTSYLDDIFLKDGQLEPFPSEALDDVQPEHIMLWCVKNAVYQLPTIELIEWLQERIGDRTALEVCAGKSGIGKALGITATDSYCQVDNPELRMYYALLRQPVVDPPSYVVKMDANSAVEHYDPDVVIGAWVTQRYQEGDEDGNVYGPVEEDFLASGRTYIHIGNDSVHGKKRLLALPHEKLYFPWLRSRGYHPEQNAIWVWND
jgi:hypothetical protein